MALKLITHPCARSIIFVALLSLHAFATHSAARPLGDTTTVQDDVMTSAEMQKWYVRPEDRVDSGVEVGDGGEGDRGVVILWDQGGWNKGGGWDEGGNWDKGGGWTNRPPWATAVEIGSVKL